MLPAWRPVGKSKKQVDKGAWSRDSGLEVELLKMKMVEEFVKACEEMIGDGGEGIGWLTPPAQTKKMAWGSVAPRKLWEAAQVESPGLVGKAVEVVAESRWSR